MEMLYLSLFLSFSPSPTFDHLHHLQKDELFGGGQGADRMTV